jgi:TctA family transporter
MLQSLHDLWFVLGVALQPHNLMWSFFGVLIGNLIGCSPAWCAVRDLDVAAADLHNASGSQS